MPRLRDTTHLHIFNGEGASAAMPSSRAAGNASLRGEYVPQTEEIYIQTDQSGPRTAITTKILNLLLHEKPVKDFTAVIIYKHMLPEPGERALTTKNMTEARSIMAHFCDPESYNH